MYELEPRYNSLLSFVRFLDYQEGSECEIRHNTHISFLTSCIRMLTNSTYSLVPSKATAKPCALRDPGGCKYRIRLPLQSRTLYPIIRHSRNHLGDHYDRLWIYPELRARFHRLGRPTFRTAIRTAGEGGVRQRPSHYTLARTATLYIGGHAGVVTVLGSARHRLRVDSPLERR